MSISNHLKTVNANRDFEQGFKPGHGCHAPGKRRRSGKGLERTAPTMGSKTQQRKAGFQSHKPGHK